MVMEPPPSPQSVGREFVRQYYTLLNQAPLHLHRFYSNNSSFIHGGLDLGDKVAEPVKGQQEIHQKIMQLNFRDCHAKIRQVDAHATLASGVVVQVSGELSNNGQPMRRFMQTFVLAPQTPKKYFVHNDIFRYQDEVFSEDEQEGADSGTTSILDESNESVPPPPQAQQPQSAQQQPQQQPQQQQQQPIINNNNIKHIPPHMDMKDEIQLNGSGGHATPKDSPLPDLTQQQQQPVASSPPTIEPMPQQQQQQQAPPPPTPSGGAGAVAPAPVAVSPPVEPAQPEDDEDEDVAPPGPVPSATPVVSVVAAAAAAAAAANTGPSPEEQRQQATPPAVSAEPVSNGQLTYAKLVKSGATPTSGGGGSGGTVVSPGTPANFVSSGTTLPSSGFGKGQQTPRASNQQQQQQQAEKDGKQGGGFRGSGRGGGGGITGRGSMTRYGSANRSVDQNDDQQQQPQQQQHQQDRRSDRRSIGGDSRGNNSLMSSTVYSDAQQLFVGNLPHNCSEADLEALFGAYGKVAEIRINNKGANVSKTLPTGSRVPNFGFVVFEDERSVQECLKRKPIYLPDNHRLNVEEKKNNKSRDDGRGSSNVGSSNRQGPGSSFDRGSQDNLGGRGGGVTDRGGRGGGSRGGGGQRGGGGGGGAGRGGMYAGQGQGGRGGQQSQSGGQQRGGGYNRRS